MGNECTEIRADIVGSHTQQNTDKNKITEK